FNVTPKNETMIDSILHMYMGIDRYIKMTVLPYDAIHHIDMHMRLLDEETLLVGEYPPGEADGPQIEANLQYVLSNFNSIWGTPYEVVRIQMPPDGNGDYPDDGPWWSPGDYRTYTNNVFVNKTVLVPTYEQQWDSTALRILQEQLPGYKIVGIDCNQIIQASGALHCITRAVGSSDPLLIAHQRLRDTNDDQNPYPVDALIRHLSGISSATLHWTADTSQGYQSVPMTLTNPSDDTWTGQIPAQPLGTCVYYYIEAQSVSGKTQVRPLTAPQGHWKFCVESVVAVAPSLPNGWAMEAAFPNPAQAVTCIPVRSSADVQGRIYLMNAMGQNVREIHQGRIPQGESKYFFFANELSAGAYLLVMEGEFGRQTQRIMVK
ncbi:MAG: agmatine deiminase family protein, partial [Bacteroidota bacterium]